MSVDPRLPASRRLAGLLLLLLLQGCANQLHRFCAEAAPAVAPAAADGAADLLAYHRQLQGLTLPELEWERQLLAAEPLTGEGRIRLAMALGQPRGNGNPGRAQALLDSVLRSERAEAQRLQPLARLLAEHYQELQKNAALADRLGQEVNKLNQQVKAGQARAELLQQKLDALAHIEQTLPMRQSPPEKWK